MEYVALGLIILYVVIIIVFYTQLKMHSNESSQKNKKVKKLFHFKRGNTPLTPEQQKRYEAIQKWNYETLLKQWKDEHL